MFEDGRPVDSMRVIVGEKATETPMMAALLRFVSVNPYWNTPPDFAQKNVAPYVLTGRADLPRRERDYQVLSDWTDEATQIDPATVNWAAVAAGKANVRLRRGARPVEFDGRHEVHDAQRLRHLPPRRAGCVQGCISRRKTAGSATAVSGWRMPTASPNGCSAMCPRARIRRSRKCRPAQSGAGLRHLSDGRRRSERREVPPRPVQSRSGSLARYFGDGRQQVAALGT